MVVKCLKGCPFNLRFSNRSGSDCWQVGSFTELHKNCYRADKNRQAKPENLAKMFMPTLRHTPEMKTKGLIDECKLRLGVHLSKDQAYRAKKRAIEMIQGAANEQYSHLRSYAEELRRSNPNSTVIIQCDTSDVGPVFERIYVCLEACKAAFAYTCRPLIGLDACFLKAQHGGQLMAAVGKDGNNQMIPIAYAVVEAETRDSWQWFLNLLLEDLNSIQQRDWGFISDQQKGLEIAIQNISGDVEHGFCVNHLYANWKKNHPGAEMKEILWLAARATTVPDWQRAMQRMKDLDEKTWTDMMKHPASKWTRSAYRTNTQCDLQVNNMSEAFNKTILDIHDKPYHHIA